jgi:MarR family transcriptional regulator, repressor for mepA
MKMKEREFEVNFQYLIRTINHKIKLSGDKRLEAHGITLEQARTMGFIDAHEEQGITHKDLETRFNRKGSSISSIIHNLEKKDFIKRTIDPKDERRKLLSLSEKGKKIVGDFEVFFANAENMLVEGFSDEEKKQLFHFLERMNVNVDKQL